MRFGFERIATPDAHGVAPSLKNGDPDLPFMLGHAAAIIVEPRRVATSPAPPTGTGPCRLESWSKGTSVTPVLREGHRAAKNIALRQALIEGAADGFGAPTRPHKVS